jgi:hypothetical protein
MYGSKHSQTRESQGWNFTLLHSTEGYPTKTASTKTTRALEEQSSLARRDTTTWLTGTGRSQGYDYLCSTKFLLWKHSHHVYFSNQYLYQIPDSYLGGSCGSITIKRHRCIIPQILHQKLTYLYQLIMHLTAKYTLQSTMKGYKAACLK